jgi:hypothetical protein
MVMALCLAHMRSLTSLMALPLRSWLKLSS